MVRLAFYKGAGTVGNALVRTWTRSRYSHCELVIDGMCYSSSVRDGGVRAKRIDLDSGHWDIVDLPWADKAAALEYWALTKSQPYDWWGLIGSQVLNRRSDWGGAAFCSEWCAAALGIPSPEIYSPGTLAGLVKFLHNHKEH